MVWTDLHAKVHRTIRARNLFTHYQRLLVAVSGGQDSLCLAKLMLDLQAKWGWRLAVAHCDHRWRVDSQANAEYVGKLAEDWGLPFYLEVANEVINSEEKARNWRYQVLTKMAEVHNFQCVVTGHTASDRAETLLYNLIRGTGADGLQALTWQRPLTSKIMLVRPFLTVTREQTEKFCQELNLKIWLDTTNEDLKYARNRIRQELLPYLRQNFNPQVETNLAQTAELLQAEVEYLEQAAEQLRLDVVEGLGVLPMKINRRKLQTVALALQRRVMRQILQSVLVDAPNFEQIEKLTALITAPNRSQTDPFPGGAIAQVNGDWIYLN